MYVDDSKVFPFEATYVPTVLEHTLKFSTVCFCFPHSVAADYSVVKFIFDEIYPPPAPIPQNQQTDDHNNGKEPSKKKTR